MSLSWIGFGSPRPACGERSDRSCDPGEGDSPRTELAESAPHHSRCFASASFQERRPRPPTPLPASGAREKINRRTVLRCFLAVTGGMLAPIDARAAAYPSRPIKIIVPFGPGGSGDITARLIGKQIEDRTKQSVVIDNRPGANGIIGTMAVKTAEPDGYTVLLITTSTHAANVSLVRNLSYDPAKDFTIVGVFRSSGTSMLVRPQAPCRDLAEFLSAAKAAPGKLTFGYFNASSRTPPEHLSRLAGT